ncbi:hypothetical protein D3C71_1642970 [compost metagenome]
MSLVDLYPLSPRRTVHVTQGFKDQAMELVTEVQVRTVVLLELLVDIQHTVVEPQGSLMILAHLTFHTHWSWRVTVGVIVVYHNVHYTGARRHVGESVVDVVHFLECSHRHLYRSQQRVVRTGSKQQPVSTNVVTNVWERLVLVRTVWICVQVEEHVVLACGLHILLEALRGDLWQNVICYNYTVLNNACK